MANVRTMKDAFRVAIKKYWSEDKAAPELKTSKDRKYTKKYFDSVGEEFTSKKEQPKKTKKKEDDNAY